MKTIRLTEKDSVSASALRFQTLLNEGTFKAEPEAVMWNAADREATVYGIISADGLLLSSMRAEVVTNVKVLVSRLDFDGLEKTVALPVGLLGKASTHAAHQGRGFNTYLRYLSYRDFHESGIETVVGTVMPSAHRIPLLHELGYRFIENPQGWRRFGYQSEGKTLVGVLDLKNNYDRIMTLLEPKVRTLKKEFPYVTSDHVEN